MKQKTEKSINASMKAKNTTNGFIHSHLLDHQIVFHYITEKRDIAVAGVVAVVMMFFCFLISFMINHICLCELQ